MEPYKKILVCLDLTHIDHDVIAATNKICDMSPREVTFINVIPDFDIPEEMQKAFPNLIENAIEERKAEIREFLKEHFEWPNADIVIKVVQGQPAKAILKYSVKGDYDLIIAGRKKKGSGILRSRLARRADCSFLMIAEGRKFDLNKILVPVDFSDNSKLALEKAVHYARLVPNLVKIYAQNIYTVPTGYRYTGKTYDEFAEIMKENAMKDYEVFFRTVDNDGKKIRPIYSLNDNDEFVSDIRDEAKKRKIDLVIIGAKGQTPTSALFIGSKAERIVQMNIDCSMLVVRRKGEKAGFMDFIDEL